MEKPQLEQVERFYQQAMEYAKRAALIKEQETTNPQSTNPQSVEPRKGSRGDMTDGEYREFLQQHPGQGALKVQVATARGVIPVKEARVEVSKEFTNGVRLLERGVTDESGILDGILLPALPEAYSLSPNSAPESATEYLVSVLHQDYIPQLPQTVAIYDQIQTILPVLLYPKADKG